MLKFDRHTAFLVLLKASAGIEATERYSTVKRGPCTLA